MKSFVIDASVLVKLFFQEQYSDDSARCVKDATQLLAPDLLWAEAANVVWKRLRRGELAADEATALVQEMLQVPVVTHAAFDLASSAIALAAEAGRTVYDCLYLALAIQENIPVLTADERFVSALKAGRFSGRIKFVGDK